MSAEQRPLIESHVAQAFRRLLDDPETRPAGLSAIEQSVGAAREPEREKLRVLAWINLDVLLGAVRRLEEENYTYEDILDDSPDAHRKVAEIQRILHALGFNLGATGVDGYTGGPPGKPVGLELDEVRELVSAGPMNNKLLATRATGATESWTRDATRRLQYFLGTVGLPRESELRIACLRRTDGMFGARTLAGVRMFLNDVLDSG